MRIELLQTHRILLPLREPYHLSYRTIDALESVWVRAQLDNGAIGWGESTPLAGYSASDVDAVWAATNTLASACVGRKVSQVLSAPRPASDGFLYAALWTALEEASGLIPNMVGKVPLAGLTQEREGETPATALRRVRSAGFRVFKMKVGYNPLQQDIERVVAFQCELKHGERIRIDANQAFSEGEASLLLQYCALEKIELLEQPLPVSAWTECARIAQQSAVPIMLDESITDFGSLDKAAQTRACKIVKLKLMKQGGMTHLREMVDHARKLGLEVVLGNGVASWMDNRHEGIFWLKHLCGSGRAGEMNGYLKLHRGVFSGAVEFVKGCLNLKAMPLLAPNPEHYDATTSMSYEQCAA